MAAQDNLARKPIYIPATQPEAGISLRVAAYCRVSTDSDDQRNSFAAQQNHYYDYIHAHDHWELADIYADEGITGTAARKRDDFQRMLADCRKGRIDKILVKSVSRFARNTTDCLEALRELKALGISVYFEEQNIDTKIASSEMMTAVIASCAQAESESISKNMRWSYQKRMESGAFITCKAPFGYRLVDRRLIVEETEARIIQMIFQDFLAGWSTVEIADKLTSMGIRTREGLDEWKPYTIKRILVNEKYIGDALLQKKYSTDTFPPVKKCNNGERPQYYVENSHQAIISRETFEAAQKLLQSKRPALVGKSKHQHLKTALDPAVWNDLIDLNALRSSIIHNDGKADEKFKNSTTFKSGRVQHMMRGDLIVVSESDVQKYMDAVKKLFDFLDEKLDEEFCKNAPIMIANSVFNRIPETTNTK